MATAYAHDKNGDLAWVNGGPVIISDIDELKQALMSILQTPLGRFIDEDVGLSYDWLLGGYEEAAARAAIEDALTQDERVVSVTKVDPIMSKDKRHVVFHIVCETTLGTVDFDKEVDIDAVNG